MGRGVIRSEAADEAAQLSPGMQIPVIHTKSEPPAPGHGSLCNFSPCDSALYVHPTAPRIHLGKSRRSVPGSGPRVPSLGARLYSESRLLATGGGHNLTTESGGDSSGVMSTEDPGSGPRTYMVAHNRP